MAGQSGRLIVAACFLPSRVRFDDASDSDADSEDDPLSPPTPNASGTPASNGSAAGSLVPPRAMSIVDDIARRSNSVAGTPAASRRPSRGSLGGIGNRPFLTALSASTPLAASPVLVESPPAARAPAAVEAPSYFTDPPVRPIRPRAASKAARWRSASIISAARGFEFERNMISANVGLFNAVASHPRGKDAIFVGTPGCETEDWGERTRREVARRYAAEERSRAVFVTDEVFDGSYRGYAKTCVR